MANRSNISSNIKKFPCWMKCWTGLADRKIWKRRKNRVGWVKITLDEILIAIKHFIRHFPFFWVHFWCWICLPTFRPTFIQHFVTIERSNVFSNKIILLYVVFHHQSWLTQIKQLAKACYPPSCFQSKVKEMWEWMNTNVGRNMLDGNG